MSYERYKDFRLAPDNNGCWDVLDKDYQQTQTFPSKAAAKRWIDAEVHESEPSTSQGDTNTLDDIFEKHLEVKGWGQDWVTAKASIQSLIIEARIEELELVEVMFETNYDPLGDIADRITKLKRGKS